MKCSKSSKRTLRGPKTLKFWAGDQKVMQGLKDISRGP